MTRPQGERQAIARVRWLAIASGLSIAAYATAAAMGVSSQLLDLVFTALLVPALPVVWWAAMACRPDLRVLVRLAAAAFTCQVLGSFLWYFAYLENGSRVPDPPGYWSPFIFIACVLAVISAWTFVRGVVRPREWLLDFSIVIASAGTVGVALLNDHLVAGSAFAAVDPLVRCVLNLGVVVLVTSALLGRWQSLPRPVGIVGLSLLCDAAGNIVFSYLVSTGPEVDDRWPNVFWFAGVMVALVAAAALICRVDGPMRLSREPLPGVSPAALAVVTTLAWLVVAFVLVISTAHDKQAPMLAGVVAAIWIGLAAPMRTLSALRDSRAAYRRLEDAHWAVERAREESERAVDERDRTIEELSQANVELRAIHTLLGSVLDVVDERSDGELRARIAETADDVVGWLPPPQPRDESGR